MTISSAPASACPLIIVSPFAKPHYVSHTPMDYTAVLKFVEKRFNLPNLTARDAAQADMEEFFDFSSPNLNPPSPASQPTNLPCNPNLASGHKECAVSAVKQLAHINQHPVRSEAPRNRGLVFCLNGSPFL